MTEADYRVALVESGVPPHTHEGYIRYLCEHILPGRFLQAILENDLRSALICADDHNQKKLYQHVAFLVNHAPADCWGSPERVASWVSQVESS